ncbi:MAG: ROK family glucokinase [Clostridia bacterium]|jgi:glucokinase|nr:ROK family glucokinase [Clostridia bacterium]
MSEKNFVFGIDIGGTDIKIGMFQKDGKLIEKWKIPTDKSDNGENIFMDIKNFLYEKISEKCNCSQIIGVGIGMPGPVDSSGVVYKCVNLGWGVLPVKNKFEEILNLPVAVGNDSDIAALGEMWQGSGKGKESLILATIGTGIGAGLILNGKIVNGFHGSSGEIGHITVDENEKEICSCGKKGCAEQYASATGMVRYAKNLIKEGFDSVLSLHDFTAKDIVEAAKEKDIVALKTIDKMGQVLGYILASAACVFDPEIIIIGGGVSKGGDIIIEAVQKYYKMYTFHTLVDTPFAIAKLGNDAGIFGAAKLLL